MACLNPDGTLTIAARKVLEALEAAPHDLAGLTAATDLPPWRIKASTRELGAAGLLAASGDQWQLTELGAEALQIDRDC